MSASTNTNHNVNHVSKFKPDETIYFAMHPQIMKNVPGLRVPYLKLVQQCERDCKMDRFTQEVFDETYKISSFKLDEAMIKLLDQCDEIFTEAYYKYANYYLGMLIKQHPKIADHENFNPMIGFLLKIKGGPVVALPTVSTDDQTKKEDPKFDASVLRFDDDENMCYYGYLIFKKGITDELVKIHPFSLMTDLSEYIDYDRKEDEYPGEIMLYKSVMDDIKKRLAQHFKVPEDQIVHMRGEIGPEDQPFACYLWGKPKNVKTSDFTASEKKKVIFQQLEKKVKEGNGLYFMEICPESNEIVKQMADLSDDVVVEEFDGQHVIHIKGYDCRQNSFIQRFSKTLRTQQDAAGVKVKNTSTIIVDTLKQIHPIWETNKDKSYIFFFKDEAGRRKFFENMRFGEEKKHMAKAYETFAKALRGDPSVEVSGPMTGEQLKKFFADRNE